MALELLPGRARPARLTGLRPSTVALATLALLLAPPLPGQDDPTTDGVTPAYRAGPGHGGYFRGGLGGRGPEGAAAVLFATTHPFPPGSKKPDVPAALIAVNGEDGALLWRRELVGRPTPPALAQGLVLVGSDGGGVTAFAAATGEERWRYKTRAGVLGQPVVAGDVVYFGGGEDKTVHAVSLEKGKKLWTKGVKGEGVYSPVRVEGDVLFAFSATHHAAPVLYALSTDKGKRLWKREKLEITPVTGPNDFELAGELLLACVTPSRYRTKGDVTEDGAPTGYLVAVAAASGEERWRVKIGPLAARGPTVSGEVVVCYARPLADGPPGSAPALHLLAFSTRDGSELWRAGLGTSQARWASTSPVIAGESVIAASSTAVRAFDLASGEERWSHPMRGAVVTCAGDLAHLAAGGGALVGVDLQSGSPRWRATLQPVESPGRGPACPGEIAPLGYAD